MKDKSPELLLDVVILKEIESGNTFINAPAWKYKEYRNKWFQALRVFLPECRRPAKKRRRLEIYRLCRRRFDEVNFFSGVKPIEDFLIYAQWIVDDAQEFCEIHREQTKAPPKSKQKPGEIEPPATRIKIFEGVGPDLPPVKRQIKVDMSSRKKNLWTSAELKKRGLL